MLKIRYSFNEGKMYTLQDLERRHFIATNECWNVTLIERTMSDASAAALSVNKPRSVDLSTFAGPFVLIMVGLVLSVAVGFAEMMYYRQFGRVSSLFIILYMFITHLQKTVSLVIITTTMTNANRGKNRKVVGINEITLDG
jgi:hypothetical protein